MNSWDGLCSSLRDALQQYYPLLDLLKDPKGVIFDFDLKELESESDEEEDSEGETSESGEVEDNKGGASESGEVEDNEGEASESGEVKDNKGGASESGKVKDNKGGASESGEVEDNEGELPESGEVLLLHQTLVVHLRYLHDEGEASESGEVEDIKSEAFESGEVKDNEGEASQSGEGEDKEGEASESDEDESRGERGEDNFENVNMEHVPKDGTMTDFMTVETRCGMQVTITTKTYNFFKDSIHQPERRTRTKYLGIKKLVKTGRNLEVFADGLGEENEGYVSIRLHNFDGSCVVSVIDASGNQRFSQSYAMSLPEDSSFIIDKFISHKRLLSDADELLPNGTLTLMIHASLKPDYQAYFKMSKIQPNILQNFQETSNGWELLLGFPLAKCLTEESNVFREMLVTPVSENSTESISIPDDEIWNFFHIGRLLMGYNPLVFDSIEQIFDMYLFADKYDMPYAGRTYVLFMHLYGMFHGTDELWEKVDEYFEKEHLKELLKKKIRLISESKFAIPIDTEDSFRLYDKQRNFKEFWFFVDVLVPYSSSVHRKLLYYNLNKTVIRLPNLKIDENEEYDFYK